MSQQSSNITQGWKKLQLTTVMFFVSTGLEEDFEENCHDNPEIGRNLLKTNGEGIVSRHYVLCRNIKVEDYWINSIATRDYSVMIENIKKVTQVS